ncbi:cation:proton antiporter [Alteromonas facilis]|uniref:cation:proton antiporter n=1 Tax=Alteromonas facilis TaxID=2048004 RepID=UPI000C28429C|nr:sodium:proton antiporter [Alteromonas facilis]
MENIAVMLVVVGLISIACQYAAYKVKLPAILFLLLSGIIVGPGINLINADALFGDLLFPIVSLSVAIILFEGALTLKFSDISGHGAMVRNLCSVGVIVTWLVATPTAHYALNLSWELAALFGAIVTVTGPTVIVPMLRTVRPSSKLANILRWEGIVIDPIGALFAVLVFEFILAQQDAVLHTFIAFGTTVLVGGALGSAFGYMLGVALRKQWIPYYLQNTAVLTLMLAAFAFSNVFAHESGLLTVTIAGMILANMRNVDVESILEFKETLSVLLISALFILLATRIDFAAIQAIGMGAVVVIAAIMFVARPLAVGMSAIGTGLTIKEQALLSWIAPRGIIAAAVSALFSIKLEAAGYEQASLIVPMVFLVIIATVVIQSLTSSTVAQWLGLRSPEQNGFLLFGASQFSRELALELSKSEINTIVADTNWDAIRLSRMQNIKTYYGNPMSDHAERYLDLSLVGSVLILSPYRQLNPLVTVHFEHELGRDATVMGLGNNESDKPQSHQVSENFAQKMSLFGEGITYAFLASAMKNGAIIKTTRLTEEFTFADYREKYGNDAIPLVHIHDNKVGVFSSLKSVSPKPGWKIISLVLKVDDQLKVA